MSRFSDSKEKFTSFFRCFSNASGDHLHHSLSQKCTICRTRKNWIKEDPPVLRLFTVIPEIESPAVEIPDMRVVKLTHKFIDCECADLLVVLYRTMVQRERGTIMWRT